MNAVSHKQCARTPKTPVVRPGNIHKHLHTVEDASIHSAAKTKQKIRDTDTSVQLLTLYSTLLSV